MFTDKMKKKAQMEIMGLAIIIILVSLAMLFIVQFVILRQPTDIKEKFTHKQLAKNTINTMLSTTSNCKFISIEDLLIDCAEGGFIQCPGGNSCTHSSSIIQEVLDNTLDKWNKKYYLTIKADNEDIKGLPSFGEQPCPGEKTSSAPCCFLPTQIGTMNINLDICG